MGGRVLGGQEQQVDVAERRQHSAPIAAGRGDAEVRRLVEAQLVRRVLVKNADDAVDQIAQQARGLQAGELLLLERVLHIGLDTGEVTTKRRDRLIARNDAFFFRAQGCEGIGQDVGGCLGGARQWDRCQHG